MAVYRVMRELMGGQSRAEASQSAHLMLYEASQTMRKKHQRSQRACRSCNKREYRDVLNLCSTVVEIVVCAVQVEQRNMQSGPTDDEKIPVLNSSRMRRACGYVAVCMKP